MKIADDTFLGNSECEWVNVLLPYLKIHVWPVDIPDLPPPHVQTNSSVLHNENKNENLSLLVLALVAKEQLD